VSNDSIGPGARVLWCLRRRASDVRCVAYLAATPIEVRILQDCDIVLIEQFVGARAAYEWASQYEARLKAHGWHDSPAEDDLFLT
jgi:hypothetical protein